MRSTLGHPLNVSSIWLYPIPTSCRYTWSTPIYDPIDEVIGEDGEILGHFFKQKGCREGS